MEKFSKWRTSASGVRKERKSKVWSEIVKALHIKLKKQQQQKIKVEIKKKKKILCYVVGAWALIWKSVFFLCVGWFMHTHVVYAYMYIYVHACSYD